MEIKLKSWIVPNFVIGKMPKTLRQDEFKPDNDPKWALADVEEEILSDQCDRFRAEVFEKAGKKDPRTTYYLNKPLEIPEQTK